MMGRKVRIFTPVLAVSLDALVPADHFYRHVERVLDLCFVRNLVQDCSVAGLGRPSIDPVVYFRLQLVMFFEGIRSERQLLRLAADRLSVRWYLGYNLDESLPDHSSLTRIRARYGLESFWCFFETVGEQCQQAGLVWGRELYFDATHVLADAALDSLVPRFAVEAREALQIHLAALFPNESTHDGEANGQERGGERGGTPETIAPAQDTDLAHVPEPSSAQLSPVPARRSPHRSPRIRAGGAR
jgi:transposase